MTIWKYVIGIATTLELPIGATFLDAQLQGADLCAWFLVDQSAKTEPRKFKIFGTGHEIPDGLKYLATFQQPRYVWHLFEEMT